MHLVATLDLGPLRTMIKGMDYASSTAFRTRLAGELNIAGAAAHAAMIAPLEKQTGLHHGTIPRAIHDRPAGGWGGLTYMLSSHGGGINLKYFNPSEQGSGVVAFPRSGAKFYPGAFIKSGWGAGRKPSPKLNGHVFTRVAGRKIKHTKSGVFIPEEMTQGATLAAFEGVVSTRLAPLVAGLLTRIAAGA
jgi:hypothetical protein